MTVRALSETFAVAPQILPTDLPGLAAQGFTAVICNRPDMENPPDLSAQAMREAAEAAGMAFHDNPVFGGALSMDNVTMQAEAMAPEGARVLAYCASGTRSAIAWALAMAGKMATDDILEATGRAGYALNGMRDQIDMLAGQQDG
jgi:uncharacterized protein (TIGR01244 family)